MCIKEFFPLPFIIFFPDGQPPKYGSRTKGRGGGLGSSGLGPPGLAEDYAEIVDEEGDYSSPARDYELDRSDNGKH